MSLTVVEGVVMVQPVEPGQKEANAIAQQLDPVLDKPRTHPSGNVTGSLMSNTPSTKVTSLTGSYNILLKWSATSGRSTARFAI